MAANMKLNSLKLIFHVQKIYLLGYRLVEIDKIYIPLCCYHSPQLVI